jgi:hypothetical protein
VKAEMGGEMAKRRNGDERVPRFLMVVSNYEIYENYEKEE